MKKLFFVAIIGALVACGETTTTVEAPVEAVEAPATPDTLVVTPDTTTVVVPDTTAPAK